MKLKMLCFLSLLLFATIDKLVAQRVYYIDNSTPNGFTPSSFSPAPGPGDTIKILSSRTKSLTFSNFNGSDENPIVFINSGGRVIINTTDWGAVTFNNCNHVKITGRGEAGIKYGFLLQGASSCLTFGELSNDCESEFIELEGSNGAFFGIYAKKDYGGNPPFPYPVFNKLAIHDMYIHHIGEGMYIGETKTPGMELKHVRVYNNIVTNTKREAIQLANCVEDVDVYNNYCISTGLDSIVYQQNIFQIGSNTVGRYHHNIFKNAPGCGVIIMGKGDLYITDNYIENCSGIFIDDRDFQIPNSPVNVSSNYMKHFKDIPFVKNMNQINDIYVKNNKHDMATTFFQNAGGTPPITQVINNQYTSIATLLDSLNNGNLYLDTINQEIYKNLGPQPGLKHVFNYLPVFDSISDVYLTSGDTAFYVIKAHTPDNDYVSISALKLPAFAQLQQIQNGIALLKISSGKFHKGVYFPTIVITDSSHNDSFRKEIKIAVADSGNVAPVTAFSDTISVEVASKRMINTSAFDADHDSIFYTFSPFPDFIQLKLTGDSAFLKITPFLNTQQKVYPIAVKADDGYHPPVCDTLFIKVISPEYYTNKPLYRINCGGGELDAEPINWQYDGNHLPNYGVNMSYATGSWTYKGLNYTDAPGNIFAPYRHLLDIQNTMSFAFPLLDNGKYRVNLYFEESIERVSNHTIGVFNVYLEDSLVLDTFSIYNESGMLPLKKSYVVDIYDMIVDLRFDKILHDAKINGIEIMFLEKSNNMPLIAPISNVSINEGDTLNIQLSYSDDNYPGSDSVSLALVNNPAFLQLEKANSDYSLEIAPNYFQSGVYDTVKVSITDGNLSSAISFKVTVADKHLNVKPVIQSMAIDTITEGELDTIHIYGMDADNDKIYFSFKNLPAFVTAYNRGSGHYILQVNGDYETAGEYNYWVILKDEHNMKDSIYAKFIMKDAIPVVRIPLNTSMVGDLVWGGSSQSPNYLVDEQDKNPLLGQAAVSLSWRPYYNQSKAPYHTIIDLGKAYHISRIYIYDMYNIADIVFSTGDSIQWTDVLKYRTGFFNCWRYNPVSTDTRYLRISMYDNTWAYVNEIALYGYELPQTKMSIHKANELEGDKESEYSVYPNPVVDILTIQNADDETIYELYDFSGRKVTGGKGSSVPMDSLKQGVYIVKIVNPYFGSTQTFKVNKVCNK